MHWNFRGVMIRALSSLVAQQVVVMTTCGATRDGKVGIMTTLCSLCIPTRNWSSLYLQILWLWTVSTCTVMNIIDLHANTHTFFSSFMYLLSIHLLSFLSICCLSLSIYSFLWFGYVVSSWWIHVIHYPYASGLLHWHCGMITSGTNEVNMQPGLLSNSHDKIHVKKQIFRKEKVLINFFACSLYIA